MRWIYIAHLLKVHMHHSLCNTLLTLCNTQSLLVSDLYPMEGSLNYEVDLNSTYVGSPQVSLIMQLISHFMPHTIFTCLRFLSHGRIIEL